MRNDWNCRAQENAYHYVATGQEAWSQEEFYNSGLETVRNHILNDLTNICQGKRPSDMKVLEIGCGAGRVTRPLAELFGEVHAVDISSDMVRLARQNVSRLSNAFIYLNNGFDLSVVPQSEFDFAFSNLVFQHVPNRQIVQNYVKDVHRLLRSESLFKFQVRGNVADWPQRSTIPG